MTFLSWATAVAKGIVEEQLEQHLGNTYSQHQPPTSTPTAAPTYAQASYSRPADDDEPAEDADPQSQPQQQPSYSYQPPAPTVPTPAVSVNDALAEAGSSIETAASLLWTLDVNRLVPGTHYLLNPQSKTEHTSHDAASEPLVVQIAESVWRRPTYAAFKRLLDNYTAGTGKPEVVSEEERREEQVFLDAICETPCIQFVYNWLNNNSDCSYESYDDFKRELHSLWFQLYSRDGSGDSSGFEHVFCGEIDDGAVKGFHNFIQVFVEEQRGNFNYQGYLDVRGDPCPDAPPPAQQMMLIRFEWLGYTKSVSSLFVGTSPEFEFALYSLLWLGGSPSARVQLGPYDLEVKIHDLHGKIGSAFPCLLSVDEEKMMAGVTAEEPSTAVEDYSANVEVPPSTESGGYEESFPSLG